MGEDLLLLLELGTFDGDKFVGDNLVEGLAAGDKHTGDTLEGEIFNDLIGLKFGLEFWIIVNSLWLIRDLFC